MGEKTWTVEDLLAGHDRDPVRAYGYLAGNDCMLWAPPHIQEGRALMDELWKMMTLEQKWRCTKVLEQHWKEISDLPRPPPVPPL